MHPKGVSPLSSGENTNSYKELLKMKKILSILLAMVMIVSSITVAFVTIAAAPIEENVEKQIFLVGRHKAAQNLNKIFHS